MPILNLQMTKSPLSDVIVIYVDIHLKTDLYESNSKMYLKEIALINLPGPL